MRKVSNPASPRLHCYATANKYQRKKIVTKHWDGHKPTRLLNDSIRMWFDDEYYRGSMIRTKSYGLKPGRRWHKSDNPIIPKGMIVLYKSCNHSKETRIYKRKKEAYKETRGYHSQMSFYRLYHNQYA